MNQPINNPLMALMQMARNGGDTMQMIRQMAGKDPRAAQAMQMMSGKNPAQLRQIAENMARERGMSLNDMASQMGFQKNRS